MTDVESEILSWETIGFEEINDNDKEINDNDKEIINKQIDDDRVNVIYKEMNILLKDKEDEISCMKDTISDFYKTLDNMYSKCEELKKQLEVKDMVIKRLSDRFAEKINSYEEIIHEKDQKIKSLEILVDGYNLNQVSNSLSKFQSYNYNDMIKSKYISHDFFDSYTLGIF